MATRRQTQAPREIPQQPQRTGQRWTGETWVPLDSSRVAQVTYNSYDRTLTVKWANGHSDYVYREVPYEVFRRMTRSKSPGQFVNRVLNGFSYGPVNS